MKIWSLLHTLNPAYFLHWHRFNRRPLRRWLFFAFPLALVVFLALLFMINPISFIFVGGTFLGLILAMGVSASINKARRQEFFDLLSVALPGKIGVCWLLARRFTHHSAFFLLARQLLLVLQIVGVITLCGLLLIDGGQQFFYDVYGGWMPYPAQYQNVIEVLLFAVIFYMDYRYSVIIGALTGIFSALQTRRRFDVSAYSLVVFLVIQFVTYLAFMGIGSVLPLLLNTRSGTILSVAMLVVSIALREGTATLLWRRIADQLDIEADELGQFERSRVYRT